MKTPSAIKRRDELVSDDFAQLLNGTPHEAARAILAAAQTGLVEAQVMLGQILLEGRGIQRDPELAFTWFGIAARHDQPMAWNMLGRCHEHGWGCRADPTQAARHYARAADSGLDWGMYNLANLLATGKGVPGDPIAAFDLYLRAAQLGHAKSMNLVGRCYEDGQGVAADPQRAFDWYRRSAEAGDFRGQFSHAAVLISQGQLDQARYWLLQALELGHLKFLRSASVELQQATLPQLEDITQAYLQRRRELEGAIASDADAAYP